METKPNISQGATEKNPNIEWNPDLDTILTTMKSLGFPITEGEYPVFEEILWNTKCDELRHMADGSWMAYYHDIKVQGVTIWVAIAKLYIEQKTKK